MICSGENISDKQQRQFTFQAACGSSKRWKRVAGSRILSLKSTKCAEFCRNSESLLQLHRFDLPRSHTRQWRCNRVSEDPWPQLLSASVVNQLTLLFTQCQESSNQKLINPWGIAKLKKYFSYWCGPSTSHWQMNRFKSTCFAKKQLKKRDMVRNTHWKKIGKLVSKRFYPILLLMEEILHHLGWWENPIK